MVRRIKKHEKALIDWLKNYAQERTSTALEYQFIQDNHSKTYQVVRTGWENDRFMYLVVFHFQIKENGKIWVWVNHTDIDLGQELKKMSILDRDIVPAFQPPFMRTYAGYAEA